MTYEITPALSARQWFGDDGHEWIARGVGRWDSWRGVTKGAAADQGPRTPVLAGTKMGNEPVANPRHATAALCLYQQSFGFDAKDVELLQRLRNEQRGVLAINRASLVQPIGAEEEVSARVDRLASLASRIAALLPPEVEK